MLFEKGAVEALDEAVRLGSSHPRGSVLDVLQLQEELVRVFVRPAAILAPVVAQDRLDLHAVPLEEGQRVVVRIWTAVTGIFEVVEPGRLLIPTQIVHPFRRKPSTDSDAKCPPIPTQPGCAVILAGAGCRDGGRERVGRGAG